MNEAFNLIPNFIITLTKGNEQKIGLGIVGYETCCHCCVRSHQTPSKRTNESEKKIKFEKKLHQLGLCSCHWVKVWSSGLLSSYPGRILSPHSSAPGSDQRSPRRRGRKWWRIIQRPLLDGGVGYTLLGNCF